MITFDTASINMKGSVYGFIQVQQNWTVCLILPACALKIPEFELLEKLRRFRDHRLE